MKGIAFPQHGSMGKVACLQSLKMLFKRDHRANEPVGIPNGKSDDDQDISAYAEVYPVLDLSEIGKDDGFDLFRSIGEIDDEAIELVEIEVEYRT